MRPDYAPYFQEFQSELSKVGLDYAVVYDSELTALLQLNSGWVLSFDCERYYVPAFTVSIAPSTKDAMVGKGYALRILMKVFEKKRNREYGLPNFHNEALFLATEKKVIFEAPDYYTAEYERLNSQIS